MNFIENYLRKTIDPEKQTSLVNDKSTPTMPVNDKSIPTTPTNDKSIPITAKTSTIFKDSSRRVMRTDKIDQSPKASSNSPWFRPKESVTLEDSKTSSNPKTFDVLPRQIKTLEPFGRTKKSKSTCVLTQYNIPLDYKNTALLSRFVSDNGRILPRRITGLRMNKQQKLAKCIRRARAVGLLPFITKLPQYLRPTRYGTVDLQ